MRRLENDSYKLWSKPDVFDDYSFRAIKIFDSLSQVNNSRFVQTVYKVWRSWNSVETLQSEGVSKTPGKYHWLWINNHLIYTGEKRNHQIRLIVFCFWLKKWRQCRKTIFCRVFQMKTERNGPPKTSWRSLHPQHLCRGVTILPRKAVKKRSDEKKAPLEELWEMFLKLDSKERCGSAKEFGFCYCRLKAIKDYTWNSCEFQNCSGRHHGCLYLEDSKHQKNN